MSCAFGILGWHVERSLSPRLHTAALRALGLAGEYRVFRVEPGCAAAAEIRGLLSKVRDGQMEGLNVTTPFKEVVLPWLDDLTDEARGIGAVNMIYQESGSVIGDNTDARGFLSDLNTQFARKGGCALILGAGGAARAVAYALAVTGWAVHVASRRLAQARTLAAELTRDTSLDIKPVALDAHTLEDIRADLALLVNATPIGSAWQKGTPWPPGLDLPPRAAVYDLVYDPRQTLLMKTAREAGLQAIGGIGMLVEQAALAFERWTGYEAPRRAMMEEALDETLILPQEG